MIITCAADTRAAPAALLANEHGTATKTGNTQGRKESPRKPWAARVTSWAKNESWPHESTLLECSACCARSVAKHAKRQPHEAR